jgi:hypothetical protein
MMEYVTHSHSVTISFREIVSAMEELLTDPKKCIALDSSKKAAMETGKITKDPNISLTTSIICVDLILPGTKAVAKAIEKCWSDNVYLFVLTDRFWKLTLQVSKRIADEPEPNTDNMIMVDPLPVQALGNHYHSATVRLPY